MLPALSPTCVLVNFNQDDTDRYILDGHPDKLTYTGTDYDKYTVNLYAND